VCANPRNGARLVSATMRHNSLRCPERKSGRADGFLMASAYRAWRPPLTGERASDAQEPSRLLGEREEPDQHGRDEDDQQ
jgi:hypothetical protein